MGEKLHINSGGFHFSGILLHALLIAMVLIISTCRKFEANQLVLIETGTASEVTYKSCQVSGDVYDLGSGGIGQHGFVWSLQKEPILEGGLKTELGLRNSTGTFSDSIGGLSPSTTYFIRAYGKAGSQVTYGKEIEVITAESTLPVVTTIEVTGVTDSTAFSGGQVSEDGGAEVTDRGVCWDTLSAPTVANQHTSNGTGTGSFSSKMQDLAAGTTYHVRAYATNSKGTGYGEEKEFTTGEQEIILPSVTTVDVADITESSASAGGIVTGDGGAVVTARGVCWSTVFNPTVSDDITESGSGVGEFSSSLIGLTCNTTYYIRSYATNSAGIAYGEQKEFITEPCPVFLPEVQTNQAYNITDSMAVSGGVVLDDGGATVTARGICWATHPGPDLGDGHTEDGAGTGEFTSYLVLLESLTTYFYRAYAINSEGTEFGQEYEFTTPAKPGFLTDIDGNVYYTVQIGEQRWMAENMKVSRYADGSPIQKVEDQSTWGDLTTTAKAFCAYAFDPGNMEVYGALYTWAAAMNGTATSDLNPSGVQGVCPDGWHMPSDAEWIELELALGMTQIEADDFRWRGDGIGTMLKDTVLWKSPNQANNETGFAALPGGHVNSAGFSTNKTIDCYFWSATDWGGGEIWYRHMWYDRTEVYRYTGLYAEEGYSVRCVKDE